MAQLLVRKIDAETVKKLKHRAKSHGISTEEEHRRILREALQREPMRKPTLAEFFLSGEGGVLPDLKLDLSRSREIEERDIDL